jgi:hypothetical protein
LIETTFIELGIQPMFSYYLQNQYEMFLMFFLLALDQVLRKHWSCTLTIFGTLTGWLKMERPSKAKIAGSRLFCGIVDQEKGY